MTPTRQTVFGDGKGNCFAACLACLFDISVEEVPNFCGCPERNPDWYAHANEWLSRRGFKIVGIEFSTLIPPEQQVTILILPGTYIIVSGKSPRGDFLHNVVAVAEEGGKFSIVCDPHPSDDGIDGGFTAVDFIVKA